MLVKALKRRAKQLLYCVGIFSIIILMLMVMNKQDDYKPKVKVIAVAAGDLHTVALKEDGTVISRS